MNKDPLLLADSFMNDSRIEAAKKLLKEALKEHQQKITGVKPAESQLKLSYTELLHQFTEVRGGKLFYPYIGSGFGKGALVELLDGSIKYDFITGIGPHCLGHNSIDLLEASIEAALNDTIMQGNLQQNKCAFDFAKLLTETSGLKHCFLSTTGVMANENALKIAFQKHFPANRILAFEHCFFGRSLAASQVTDKPGFREGLPLNYGVDYVPFYEEKNPKASIEALKKHIKRYPKQHAVMILELVQGEGGFYTAPKEFFLEIIKVLKENNIAVFIDEVQTFGRTSKLFAFQHYELDGLVDIVSIGKLSQACATLFKEDYLPRPGLLSQTFTASTSALYAGLTIINKLLDEGYYGKLGKIMQMHELIVSKLQKLSEKYPEKITGPFGIGAMIAFTPFQGNAAKALELAQKLFDAGLICFTAGSDPTRIRFLPPFGVMTTEDISAAMQILDEVLCTL